MDILTLAKTLTTTAPVVQLARDLQAGRYRVSLQVVDATGATASASLMLTISAGVVRPSQPTSPVNPVNPSTPTPRPRRGPR